MDAEAKAEFGYDVGEMAVTLDVIQGKVTFNKDPFKTDIDVDASVGVSGYMALKFAASASLGICLGPTQDACITLTVDANQISAAGFDAFAGVSYDLNSQENSGANELAMMYTDELEYKATKKCEGELGLAAGYWQFVKEPSVHVGLVGTSFADGLDETLYKYDGKILQKTVNNFCLALDLK